LKHPCHYALYNTFRLMQNDRDISLQAHCVSETIHLGDKGSQKIRKGTHRYGTSRHPTISEMSCPLKLLGGRGFGCLRMYSSTVGKWLPLGAVAYSLTAGNLFQHSREMIPIGGQWNILSLQGMYSSTVGKCLPFSGRGLEGTPCLYRIFFPCATWKINREEALYR